ncbi:hypothetical protein E4T56_gene6752, partial [Termitomyces sp. T112]
TNLTLPPPPSLKGPLPPHHPCRHKGWTAGRPLPLLPATPTKDQSPNHPKHMLKTQRSTPLNQHNAHLRRRLKKTPTPRIKPSNAAQKHHGTLQEDSQHPCQALGTLPMVLHPIPTTPGLANTDSITPLRVSLTSSSYKLKSHFAHPGTTKMHWKQRETGPNHPLTLPLEPPPPPPPNQSPSGPAPPPIPPPTPAKPLLHLPPLSTTTPGPLHYAADAPPATSPPLPSPAATLEADPQTSAPTHPGLTQMLRKHCPRGPSAPAPSLTPKTTHFSNRQRIWKDTYKGSPCTLKRPHWPANPPSASLPPTPPTVKHPPAPFPTPPPLPQTTPPAASDAPASPIPLALTLLPLTPRCSAPAPMPPSSPVPHLNPPSPIKAPLSMPSMPPLEPPPACEGRPP